MSDPDGGNLTVKFYGRKKADPNAKFAIIGLPDTQFYTEEPQGQNSSGGGHNGIFKVQTQWIANHRTDSAIAFVVQLGDCVQNGDNPPGADDQIEWRRADTSFKKIEFPAVPLADGIPYGICVGNHDQGTIGNPDAPSVFYNQYFGETRFTGRGYYGGHMGTNNDNHFELFSAGGIDFIHISIEYYPNGTTTSLQAVLDWADALLKAFPNRKGIVSSHNLLGTGNPAGFQGPGQKFYDDLKDNPNFILMLAGHVAGEGRRTDVFSGNTVHTLMSDYQSGYTNGGNGYLRILQFIPAQNLLSVKTYSPYSGTSLTGSGSQFTLPVNLTTAFELIGTSINVASGTQTCVNWPSLEPGQIYEWYAEVIDESNNTTTGPLWTFTVPPPAPPSVTTQPLSQTICSGDAVTFSSAASGDPVLAVYWQLSTDNGNNWTTIPGETNSSLTFNAAPANDGYQYRSIWTNTAGNDTSNAAILSIQTYSITVTQNANGNISPAGITVQCHATQLFTISANNCFFISDVLVDGVSVGPVGNYTFNDITANHTITAIYAPVVINILNSTAAVPIVCPGDNTGSISINAAGGTAPLEYSIDGGNNYSNSNSFTNLAGAVYAVRIRDANGCTKDTSISLEPIVVHWTGTVNNNWHNAGNWSSNKVPDALTHVVIDGGTPNVCMIGTANAEAASLRVKTAADIEIARSSARRGRSGVGEVERPASDALGAEGIGHPVAARHDDVRPVDRPAQERVAGAVALQWASPTAPAAPADGSGGSGARRAVGQQLDPDRADRLVVVDAHHGRDVAEGEHGGGRQVELHHPDQRHVWPEAADRSSDRGDGGRVGDLEDGLGQEPLRAVGAELGRPPGRRAGRAREQRDLVALVGERRPEGREVGLDAPVQTQPVGDQEDPHATTPPVRADSSAARTIARLRRPSPSEAGSASPPPARSMKARSSPRTRVPRDRREAAARAMRPARGTAAGGRPAGRSRAGARRRRATDARCRSMRSVPRSPTNSMWSANPPRNEKAHCAVAPRRPRARRRARSSS